MPSTKLLLERATRGAPEAGFDLEDLRRRREGRERGRRLRAGALGLAIAAALVFAGVRALPTSEDGSRAPLAGGLPAAERPPRALSAGEYSFQRILLYGTCEATDLGPSAPCAAIRLHLESWWALDDSGRKIVMEQHAYGPGEIGRFGPGEFPDEGDLSDFPTDPAELEAYLLGRAAPDGASPRPEVTPAPGVPLEEGLLWNSIQDHLGSTQYLNATPALRAAMLQVLAAVPMVNVHVGGTDPIGRAATVLSFRAYGADWEVFVATETGDFMAMTGRYEDDGDGNRVTLVTLVEAAGFTDSDDERPRGEQRTITPAP